MAFASKLVESKYAKEAAKQNKKDAEASQRAGMQLINELDYEPMYASQNVPTYQRSQSPVARSYLESFLAGNNPDATFSGAPNAKVTKRRQQESQDAMFGTMGQRVAQQRAMETATPWKVATPTRQVNPNRGTDEGSANWTLQNSNLAASGVNKNLAEALASTGTDLAAKQARIDAKKGGMDSWMDYATTNSKVENLLKVYGNDANKLADAIRAAGGLDNLAKQHSAGKER